MYPPKHARLPRQPYSLPAVQMPRDGMLFLGFKDFVPGANKTSDALIQEWAAKEKVEVQIDRFTGNKALLTIAAEAQARSGHDILYMTSWLPHIYAKNADDLFFAQGFIAAQDRLFQLDLWRRTALGEVGLMDERFRLYFDDVDISLRMHLGGWEVWCVPQAEIVHCEQRASRSVMSPAWRWHLISLCKFAWKHKGLGPPYRAP